MFQRFRVSKVETHSHLWKLQDSRYCPPKNPYRHDSAHILSFSHFFVVHCKSEWVLFLWWCCCCCRCWVMMRTFVEDWTRVVLAVGNGRPMLISALGAAAETQLKWKRCTHSSFSLFFVLWGPHACQKQLVMASSSSSSSRWSYQHQHRTSQLVSQSAVISQAHTNFHISQWITGSISRETGDFYCR